MISFLLCQRCFMVW